MVDLPSIAQHWGVETGYHDVFGHWHAASPETQQRLVAALSQGRAVPPEVPSVDAEVVRAFQGDGGRHWVLAVQLYALRSRRNWGHGDFTDLTGLIAVAAAHGAAGIGLNPLHALFTERAEEASPYAPNSRIFLNPLYIDVDAIPEFPGAEAAGLAGTIETLRAGDLIDYAPVARAKLAGLRLAYEGFRNSASKARRADFEAYRREQGEALLRFGCFEALRARFTPKSWPQWPEPWRRPDVADLRAFRQQHLDQIEFHEFMQWVADSQLRDCKEAARRHRMAVGLYIDLAVGMHPHGADAWSQQDLVLADMSVGAPPDEFNPAGQNWGLAPFNPHALAVDDFAPMRRLMDAAMRHAGAIRLDHVLGLKRVFMIPHGRPSGEGAYVRFPFEALLQVIAQESLRWRCVVIGEDLGTVPEGFRETLARWGLWAYRVMLFERDRDGRFRPPEAYPADALATFNTHDLPSFHGWLNSHDLGLKRAIGVDPGESDDARNWAKQMLAAALDERASGFAANEIAAVAALLAATPSHIVAIALDDVVGAIDQINIPGTVDQHPNWRRRLPVLLEDLDRCENLRRVGDAFAQAGRGFRR